MTDQATTISQELTQPSVPVAQQAPLVEPQAIKPQADMSAKFAALAKKERIARQQSQRIKQLETQIAERERAVAERERSWEDEFKKSPLEAIKRRGYSYEDLTKAALNDGKFQPETEIKEVRSELDRMRQEQADKEKKAIEAEKQAEQQREQQAVETFKTNIAGHIESNKEKYELTALFEAEELVFQTVEEHYLRTSKDGKPKILSLDEACDLVESYLENEIERTATSSKKFQSKFQALKAQKETEAKPTSKTSTTLTNDFTPSSSAPSMLPTKTENDRIKRALAALG